MNYLRRIFNLPIRWYMALVIAVGAIERWLGIGTASIWHDEGFTMMLAPMSPTEIIARTSRDVHPPLYYETLHYWMRMFGDSETAARSLSAACTLAIIPIVYGLIRRIWDQRAARFATLFVAIGPFLIRYSQEARMYGMVAFLAAAATYALVRGIESNRWRWWIVYTVLMAAGLYAHYYAIFMIGAHWIYMTVQWRYHRQAGIGNPRWWIANLAILALFAPWIPIAYHQFTRVQDGFWIPPVNPTSLASTIFQFAAFVPSTVLPGWLAVIMVVPLPFGGYLMYRRAPAKRPELILLLAYCALAPVCVFALSLYRPIYIDRYFVFASVGFYALAAVFISLLRGVRIAQATLAAIILAAIGLVSVHLNYYHKMRDIGAYVDQRFQPGDVLISGEAYTFFDFSYYNHTGAPVHIWQPEGVSGYDESSLYYDQPQRIIHNLASVRPATGRVWMVGRTTADRDYYNPTSLPSNWRPIGSKVIYGDSAVQAYRVLPRDSSEVAVQ